MFYMGKELHDNSKLLADLFYSSPIQQEWHEEIDEGAGPEVRQT